MSIEACRKIIDLIDMVQESGPDCDVDISNLVRILAVPNSAVTEKTKLRARLDERLSSYLERNEMVTIHPEGP